MDQLAFTLQAIRKITASNCGWLVLALRMMVLMKPKESLKKLVYFFLNYQTPFCNVCQLISYRSSSNNGVSVLFLANSQKRIRWLNQRRKIQCLAFCVLKNTMRPVFRKSKRNQCGVANLIVFKKQNFIPDRCVCVCVYVGAYSFWTSWNWNVCLYFVSVILQCFNLSLDQPIPHRLQTKVFFNIFWLFPRKF